MNLYSYQFAFYMNRYYYSATIATFLDEEERSILGNLNAECSFSVDPTQRDAWVEQIRILKQVLAPYRDRGAVYFEYSIPRLGRRIDVVLLIGPAVFVLEFKVREREFAAHAVDQVCDYALDLKNFHEASHHCVVVPILIATNAPDEATRPVGDSYSDRLLKPARCNANTLGGVIESVLKSLEGAAIEARAWEAGRYCPTPTIVEAATALYNEHSVTEISRSDASAKNLSLTSEAVSGIIETAKQDSFKAICFVTGVPGAGKTLVGLNIATQHIDKDNELYSVFLSGNGPLVDILREALARDKVRFEKEQGRKLKKSTAMSDVKMFIQNVHHFRDDCLVDPDRPPIEHVALFDEAQRAWNREQTQSFMLRKKKRPNFEMSEPEFLISCMDRHRDWAVIVCLVGGGQEINTGEAGIGEWIESLIRTFPEWRIFISSQLADSEYGAGRPLELLQSRQSVVGGFLRNPRRTVLQTGNVTEDSGRDGATSVSGDDVASDAQGQRVSEKPAHEGVVTFDDNLHLGVSMRSFRSENVSLLVKKLLDLEAEQAREVLRQVEEKYPIVITRDLGKAKRWLKERARGSERFGIIASSQAQRLKPHAIDVKSPMDPIHWFLDGKEDVRSSYYLEDVATEFHVQGLELDWTCVTWDGDLRFKPSPVSQNPLTPALSPAAGERETAGEWEHWSFVGSRWQRIRQEQRQNFLKNAYRVLLTRARQGMVVFVPEGDAEDPTRSAAYYDATYEYLRGIGFGVL